MELDLLEGVAQGQEGASVKVGWVGVEWEERALELDPSEVVSAPIVGRSFLTKWELPAIT